jgi:5-(carboxyamino)imidazole ribonucleotide synthase
VHAQDKIVMREALARMGAPVPRFRVVTSADEAADFGFPCVLKTARGGYDGKGVWFVGTAQECAPAFETAARTGVRILAEEQVAFRRELSALVVRSPSGQAAAYPVVESTQRDGICREVIAPAPDLPPERAARAEELALRIARELDVNGVLAVELFETDDGVLVNELAMRPHNTGHWTQDGAVTSQFENHLRAVLDLPLGSPVARAPWSVMVNILGGTIGGEARSAPILYDGYPHALARDPLLRVHLYGKEPRPGRKVGHVNAYGDDLHDCLERARHAAAWFAGELGDESE